MKIILGSQSKGRKQIFEEMGYQFEVMSSNIDEKAIRFEDPKELTLALAKAKAEALKPQILESAILITSDQVVVWNNEIREKPQDEKEAREYLEGYNIYPAETVTAVVVTNLATGKQAEGIDIAKVHFNEFLEKDIEDILNDGRTFEIAGGFTVDGELWESHIKEIEGTRDSVIGLPKELTERLMNEVLE
ncbi:MAG: Maf family nucleotide pyrophosphatase [Candidatus Paceibacterota bacterium]